MSKGKRIVLGIAGLLIVFIIGLLSLFGYLFSEVLIEEFSSIEAKPLPHKNPATFVFNSTHEQVRSRIITATKYPEADSRFPFKTSDRLNAYFYLCESKDEMCLSSNQEQVKEIFMQPENENDIYLASDGSRVMSPVYHAAGKPLAFRTDFHIHLETTEGNKTIVTILPINPTVYKGYGGVGLHGAILKEAFSVEPTTVEEYQLLRYIGFVLGEENMPEVVLPE